MYPLMMTHYVQATNNTFENRVFAVRNVRIRALSLWPCSRTLFARFHYLFLFTTKYHNLLGMSRRHTETATIRETRFRRTTIAEQCGRTYQSCLRKLFCCSLVTLVISRKCNNTSLTRFATNHVRDLKPLYQ